MPRPAWSHKLLLVSGIVLPLCGPLPEPSPEAFIRRSYGRRVRSNRFTPSRRRVLSRQLCAELGFPPLLRVESIAPSPIVADLLLPSGPLRSSSPVFPDPAEPSLLFVESTAPPPPALPRSFVLSANAAVFVPSVKRSSLRASAPPLPRFLFPHSNTGSDPLFFVLTHLSSHLERNVRCRTIISFRPNSTPPPRPNSDPRANSVPPNAGLLQRVISSLDRDAWAFYLRDYPERGFVDTLLHIIDHGANVGSTGDRLVSQSSRNLPSSLQHLEAIDDAISTQLSKGRISGPFAQTPHFLISVHPLSELLLASTLGNSARFTTYLGLAAAP
ncbi:hypothetical protein B0H14DRAFT_3522189 [Mycena olivaceomarginata]|nr:hypothetical protein B0H14DRAFT_3522189 [Mycena olivaceomarginata]